MHLLQGGGQNGCDEEISDLEKTFYLYYPMPNRDDNNLVLLRLMANYCAVHVAPMAQVDDGKMDLGVIYHIGRLKVLKMFNQLKSVTVD